MDEDQAIKRVPPRNQPPQRRPDLPSQQSITQKATYRAAFT